MRNNKKIISKLFKKFYFLVKKILQLMKYFNPYKLITVLCTLTCMIIWEHKYIKCKFFTPSEFSDLAILCWSTFLHRNDQRSLYCLSGQAHKAPNMFSALLYVCTLALSLLTRIFPTFSLRTYDLMKPFMQLIQLSACLILM